MNPDPPTLLANTETTKLLKLKILAENTLDGYSTDDRIFRNPVLGTCLTLPAKRTPPKTPSRRQPKQPRVNFTAESVNSSLDTDPTILD